MTRRILPAGKLPVVLLRRLLGRYGSQDPRVILGPGVGRDAAVIDLEDRLLVAKSDPITFAAEEIGWYVVNVNANDVATLGCKPRWFLATILLPEGKAREDDAEAIFQQIHEACETLGVSLCGGHTEITLGLERPLISGMMLGEMDRERLVRPDGAMPGDRLLLTKGIAIEGTAVLAREHGRLRERLSPEELERCHGFLRHPGISVVAEALLACEAATIHAMHDPTEGGIATALHEMAESSSVGLRVHAEAMPVYPETRRICEVLGLNPLGLLASGALLLCVPPEGSQRVVSALEGAGIPVSDIGEMTEAREGVRLLQEGKEQPMPVFLQDEVARALA
jgi:hydrogenase maturation factor